MKKPVFYMTIAMLYLLTPFCILMALGAMLSKKYEVDQQYWKAKDEKEIATLDAKGRNIDTKMYTYGLTACVCFVTASLLVVKRNRVIRK